MSRAPTAGAAPPAERLRACPPRPGPRPRGARSRAGSAAAYAGPLVCVLLLGKVHAATIGHYDFSGSSRFSWSCAYVAVLWLTIYASGLPDKLGRRSRVAAAVGANGVAALAVSMAQLALGSALLPRFVVFGTAVLLVPWLAGLAVVVAGRSTDSAACTRVVAVVDQAEAEALHAEVRGGAAQGISLATLPADAHASNGRAIVDAVLSGRAPVLVLNRVAQLDPSIVRQAAELHAAGIRVRDLRQFYEECFAKVPLTELAQSSLLFDIAELHSRAYVRAKRLIDVIVGVAGLPLLAVAVPLVVVADLIGNPGPLFFRQERVGKNGVPFEMIKFRSMRPGPTSGHWTTDGDARLTPVGRAMRRLHVDELPQIVNVLRGDLAIVGPRPEQPQYVEDLQARVPFYESRHLIRPGLTGWAQVNYGYGSSAGDAMEKLQYDFYYMRRQSVVLDLRILARTLRSVVEASGR